MYRKTALVFAAAILLHPQVALPCGGTPPTPTCSKSLSLAKGMRQVFVNSSTAPISVPVPIGMFLTMTSGPGGSLCPPTPGPAVITVTATCAGGPGATATSIVPLTVGGWTTTVVPLAFPPGPGRRCQVRATASSTCVLTDGTTLTATAAGDVEVCLVDPIPGSTTVPRLDLALITGDNVRYTDGETLQKAHPGDSAQRYFRVTNNHPTMSVTINLDGSSNQTALYPDPSGAVFNPNGSGLFAISDPGRADDFPIAFSDTVPCDGCLSLPDPATSVSPVIHRGPITLAPGDSYVASVTSRAWGMCADGSCSEQAFVVTGRYADGTTSDACAQASHLVDVATPPNWDWADAGAAGKEIPAGPVLITGLQPAPAWQEQLTTEPFGTQAIVQGSPRPVQVMPTTSIGLDWARIQRVVPLGGVLGGAPFQIDSFFDVFSSVSLTQVTGYHATPGVPPGYQDLFPYGMGMIELTDPSGMTADVELFEQVSVWAQARSGDIVPVEISWSPFPTGAGWGWSITGMMPFLPFGGDWVMLHIMSDQRHFAHSAAPPVCLDEAYLIASDLRRGKKMHFYMENFDPALPVHLLYSTTGPGTFCLPTAPGVCAGIRAPKRLTTLTPTAGGVAQTNLTMPATAPAGARVWLQALQVTGGTAETSNVVERTIQP